jgi:hypothetical protein
VFHSVLKSAEEGKAGLELAGLKFCSILSKDNLAHTFQQGDK